MAYYTLLIALSGENEQYKVVSQIQGSVKVLALSQDKLFNNVSENSFYLDEAAVLHKENLAQYLHTDSPDDTTYQWYKSLPSEVNLILVHKLELESGLPS